MNNKKGELKVEGGSIDTLNSKSAATSSTILTQDNKADIVYVLV